MISGNRPCFNPSYYPSDLKLHLVRAQHLNTVDHITKWVLVLHSGDEQVPVPQIRPQNAGLQNWFNHSFELTERIGTVFNSIKPTLESIIGTLRFILSPSNLFRNILYSFVLYYSVLIQNCLYKVPQCLLRKFKTHE